MVLLYCIFNFTLPPPQNNTCWFTSNFSETECRIFYEITLSATFLSLKKTPSGWKWDMRWERRPPSWDCMQMGIQSTFISPQPREGEISKFSRQNKYGVWYDMSELWMTTYMCQLLRGRFCTNLCKIMIFSKVIIMYKSWISYI